MGLVGHKVALRTQLCVACGGYRDISTNSSIVIIFSIIIFSISFGADADFAFASAINIRAPDHLSLRKSLLYRLTPVTAAAVAVSCVLFSLKGIWLRV
jgi:hypothetical protein